SRRRHTRFSRDWSSDVCSSDLSIAAVAFIAEQCRSCGAESEDRILDNRTTIPYRIKKVSEVIVVCAFVSLLYFIHQFFRLQHAFSSFRGNLCTRYRRGPF